MTRQPRSTVAPRPYTDLELVELEETARACGKIVRLVFEDGSVIEREDHIGIDRAMAIAFCRDIVTLRARLAACQAFIFAAVDEHGLELHEEGCPEDDTCSCPRVAEANRLLAGWTPPEG